jgi:hypothetical protein
MVSWKLGCIRRGPPRFRLTRQKEPAHCTETNSVQCKYDILMDGPFPALKSGRMGDYGTESVLDMKRHR